MNRLRRRLLPSLPMQRKRVDLSTGSAIAASLGFRAKFVININFVKAFSVSLSLIAASVSADDTEVFFGQLGSGLNTYPNVLFILDTSDSMVVVDSGETESRMARMREALHTVVDSAENINMGMMRLNGPSHGGSVIAPVRPIDDTLCAAGECDEISLTQRIRNSSDDVGIAASSTIDLSNSVLSLGGSGALQQSTALRFDEVQIPQGATITDARLIFTSAGDDSLNTDLQISVVEQDDVELFDNTPDSVLALPTGSSVAWPAVEAWDTDSSYTSPSITTLVQEVVNRPGFCGGDAIGFVISGSGERKAKSIDHLDNEDSPVLQVTFDSSTIPANGGCVTREIVSSLDHHSSDAHQLVSNGAMFRDADILPIPFRADAQDTIVALRFNGLAIPQGATIVSALIDLQASSHQTGEMKASIRIEPVVFSGRFFSTANNHLANRSKSTTVVPWSESTEPAANQSVTTPELVDLAQQLVDLDGWDLNSPMTFYFTNEGSSTGFREFKSFEAQGTGNEPRLRIKYQYNATQNSLGVAYTTREELKRLVDEMDLTLQTPLQAAQYEAANYFLGRNVEQGLIRGGMVAQNRVSHPDSYTGGTVYREEGCTDANLGSEKCASEAISSGAVYKSPIVHSCQTNHVVLLSDGRPTANLAQSEISTLIGQACSPTARSSDVCGVDLAKWMYETDHDTSLSGLQNITTHTIGYNISHQLLQDVAAEGGGRYYDASSAADLIVAFESIIDDVSAVDTSFVTPATTINQFNRLAHDEDLYFALFKPSSQPSWSGNLKRYQVKTSDSGEILILDKNDAAAIDPATGFFAASAHSFWSSAPDGASVSEGGAAEQLDSLPDARRVFTDAGVDHIPSYGVALTNTDLSLSKDNDTITDDLLGIAGMAGTDAEKTAYRDKLLDWAQGIDVDDTDGDGSVTDARQFIGDPMHTKPSVINYNNGTTWDRSIMLATNEGFLHSIDGDTGRENWAFMPKDLLGNINDHYVNSAAIDHPYGLDGEMTVWLDDSNGNSAIDSGEAAYLFLGMRRGGQNYYAFDISDRENPRLAWVIRGGQDAGFEEMGQSWSAMTPTRMIVGGVIKNVLVFSAGYSTAQDDQRFSQTYDNTGRGIYIVEAESGEKVWSGLAVRATGDGINQEFSDMRYSMPGSVRVIDVNQDGLADQFYASDTGGRIWRFDVRPNHQSGDLMDGGIMADLGRGTALDENNERRFYYEPDVSINTENGTRYIAIAIGSGWRAHPLDRVIDDRVYVIRSTAVFEKPEDYGIKEGEGTGAYWRPMGEYDLHDATNDIDASTNTNGWMIRLAGAGEKVLAETLTVNGQLLLTTYEPEIASHDCGTAIGKSAVYVMDVANGRPTIDLDGDGVLTVDDRKRDLSVNGIAPGVAGIITGEGGVIAVGPEQPLPEFDFGQLTQRTYWRDRSRNPSELSQEAALDD